MLRPIPASLRSSSPLTWGFEIEHANDYPGDSPIDVPLAGPAYRQAGIGAPRLERKLVPCLMVPPKF